MRSQLNPVIGQRDPRALIDQQPTPPVRPGHLNRPQQQSHETSIDAQDASGTDERPRHPSVAHKIRASVPGPEHDGYSSRDPTPLDVPRPTSYPNPKPPTGTSQPRHTGNPG